MFKMFLAVLFALLVFRCATAAEPSAYEQFRAGCVEVYQADADVPAGWCDCLVAGMRKAGVTEDELAAAQAPVAPAETFFAVRAKLHAVANACRAQLRGDLSM